MRIVHKIKRNGKIKSKFKLRKKGKVIDVLSGTILKKVNDDICTPVSLESLMASRSVSPCGHDGDPATRNKKRKLKQRYKSQDRFYLDKNNPYTIRFSYPNAGYNYDYIPNKPCMSRQ